VGSPKNEMTDRKLATL